jgi:hypothetical protein
VPFQPYSALVLVVVLALGCTSTGASSASQVAGVTEERIPGATPASEGGSPTSIVGPDRGLYPDLRTQPPADLFFDAAEIDGQLRQVLRFTNRILNGGLGTLEVHGSPEGGQVQQRIFQEDGSYIDSAAGEVVHHPTHNHWHFDSIMTFEVWERAEYQRWLASGRTSGAPRWHHSKLSSCLLDSEFAIELPQTPGAPMYDEQCLPELQGISSGWIDSYDWTLPDQWVVLEPTVLPDGQYVLRSISDPGNRIWESADGADPAVEGIEANEAVTLFIVANGELAEP